jgi:hypothetical protein
MLKLRVLNANDDDDDWSVFVQFLELKELLWCRWKLRGMAVAIL